MVATVARPAPASRSGSWDNGTGAVTGRTKASNSAVDAPARTELTTPEKSTRKPTTTMTETASQVWPATSVPRLIRTAQATASPRCARSRCVIGPVKSTSSSIENDPNAAKVAIVGEPMTWLHSANRAGITIAVRPARRVAASSGSRLRSHEAIEPSCVPLDVCTLSYTFFQEAACGRQPNAAPARC
ncbi:hypothetical protein [Streptomyces sp. SD15]